MERLRVRIISFRDYLADGEIALLATDFFKLPRQAEEFTACIQSIIADGGDSGDPCKSGLETLAYAIKSDWGKVPNKKRHIIVLWTVAPAHDLGHGSSASHYPKGMPKNMEQLTAQWDGMDYHGKRLVLFAPDEGHWRYISDNWDNVIHFPSPAGIGMTESIYNSILYTLFDI